MYVLRVLNREAENSWRLSTGKNLVGRDADCAVRLDDARVSRHHADLIVFEDHVIARDLESRNGVFVNGRRVREGELRPGDRLGLGPVTLVLEETGDEEARLVVPTPEQQAEAPTRTIERGGRASTPVVDRERLHVLYDIVDTVVGSLHVEEILPAVLEVLDRLFYYDRCAIASRGPSGDLVVRASRPAQAVVPFSRTVVERVLDRGEALLFDDIQGQTSFTLGESVIGLNIRSVLCSPMVSRGHVRGLVYLDRSVAGAYDAKDLALLRSACQTIAIALENARLYEDLQNRYENKANELQEVERRLIESERGAALGRLAQTIAHELRNPIAVIGGLTRRIARRAVDSDLHEAARAVVSETERLERMVRRVEAVIDLPEPSYQLLPLEAALERAIAGLAAPGGIDPARIEVDSSLARRLVPHDPTLTQIALVEVLQNACQALPADRVLKVTVEEAKEGWTIHVRDKKAPVRGDAFKTFFDHGLVREPWVDDIALTLAHEAMARQGGEIRLKTEAETGIEVQLIFAPDPPEAQASRR